jgi:hypothetical protein
MYTWKTNVENDYVSPKERKLFTYSFGHTHYNNWKNVENILEKSFTIKT